MHVLSSEQFNPVDIEVLFSQSDIFRMQMEKQSDKRDLAHRYSGAALCSLFYEPSTRTRLSFERAAGALGVQVVSTENAKEFSSTAKGETLEDTIRVLNEYNFDVIVLRHHETGAATRAASVSSVPILNAGDGKGEHPTQSLLDAYTIQRELGRLENLHIVMGGDLKQGRTARSLAKILTKYPGNRMTFVSSPQHQMSEDVLERLSESGTKYELTADINYAFRDADVVYWTRLQKERMKADETFSYSEFMIDEHALKIMPANAIIMHPLPRTGEIDTSVDADPRAKYFEQAGNGLFIRMALLDQILR